jgi:predicted nucleic acid-binding protein
VTTFVVDASIVLHWFGDGRESSAARALAREELVAPPLLYLEVLNVAGRRWGWPEEALVELPRQLDRSGVTTEEPPLRAVAQWLARGLTASDASYVALAEERACPLVTDDLETLELAPEIARPLDR